MFIRIHYFTFKKNALENLFVIINVQMSTLVKFFPFKKEFFPPKFLHSKYYIASIFWNYVWIFFSPPGPFRLKKNIKKHWFESVWMQLFKNAGLFSNLTMLSRNILKVQVSVTSPSKNLLSLLPTLHGHEF